MPSPTPNNEVDPLMRYIINHIESSAPRSSENIARPIALPKGHRKYPLYPWTRGRASIRQKDAADQDSGNSTRSIETKQSPEDAQWELDDIQESLLPDYFKHNREQAPEASQPQSADHGSDESPHPPQKTPPKLPFPVVLPQRRPKRRPRGFIKGYAPALSHHGISETKFLNLLDDFDDKNEDPTAISVINLASDGLLSPNMADWPMLVGIDLDVPASSLDDTQTSTRINRLLETANNEVFRPSGLYCLAASYMPDSAEGYQRVNVQSPAALHTSYTSKKPRRHIPAVTRKARENMFSMEAAPLVFPGLEWCRNRPDHLAEAMKGKPTKTQQLVHDYYCYSRDRGRLETNHEGSIFSERSRQTVMTRYAHPQTVATTGSFMSLSSGQYINPPSMTPQPTGAVTGAFVSKRRQGDQEGFPSAMEETVRRTESLSMSSGGSDWLQDRPSRSEYAQSRRITTTSLRNVCIA